MKTNMNYVTCRLREINDVDFFFLQGVHGEEVALGAEQTFHRSSTRGAARGY